MQNLFLLQNHAIFVLMLGLDRNDREKNAIERWKKGSSIMPQILFVFVSPTVVQRNINQPYESVHK